MTHIATIPANALAAWMEVAPPNPPPILKDEYVRRLLAEIGKPKPMLRNIQIEPVLNGWIVHCGCQRIVFTDKQNMLREIGKYYADPQGTERRYLEKRANKTEHLPGQPPISVTLGAGASEAPRAAR